MLIDVIIFLSRQPLFQRRYFMITKNPTLPSITIQVLKRELSLSSNEIIQNIINNLVVEYDSTGTVSEDLASNLIGKRPKPPKSSSDTQFNDAWLISDREYDEKLRFVRQYIANLCSELQS